MNKKHIETLKKDIKNTLTFFLNQLENDVVLHGALSQSLERAVRLQVYLELEAGNEIEKDRK